MISFSQFKLTVYQVQTMHHESLYINHLPSSVREKYKISQPSNSLDALFSETGLAWELGEIEMVGYVGLFHLWEKFSKEFITEALGKKREDWPKLNGRKTYPQIVFYILESMEINISPCLKNQIEEANSVVNAYKHGDNAIEKLMKESPVYFFRQGDPDSFYIPESFLKNLFGAVLKFWEEIEHQVKLVFTF